MIIFKNENTKKLITKRWSLISIFLLVILNITICQSDANSLNDDMQKRLTEYYNIYKNNPSETQFVAFMDSISSCTNSFMQNKEYATVGETYRYCIRMANENNDEKVSLKFTVLLGNYYKIKGEFRKSNEVLLGNMDKDGLDYDKAQQLLLIASNYFQIDLKASKPYMEEAQKIISTIKDTSTLMLYHFNWATYYRNNNDTNNAIQHEILAMKYMDNFPVQKVGSLMKLSDYMLDLNNLKPAFDYLAQASLCYDPIKDKRTHSFVLLAKSKLYNKQKNYTAAIEAALEAYEYLKTTKLINQQAKSLYFLASYYLAADNQLQYENIINELKALIGQLEDNSFKETSLIYLSKYELKKGNKVAAEKYFYQINEDNHPDDFAGKGDYLALKSKILTNRGQKNEAIKTLQNLISYKDSLESLDTKNIVAYQESQYDRSQKEKEISQLNSVSEAKSKKLLLISILSSALALILLLVLWFYKKLQSKNNQIFTQNEQLKELINDKDFLLKEIHHRVKNNLQVVSSLLNLQSNYIEDQVALDAINEGKNRVGSMALIHQNLYTNDNLTSIETNRYFDDLIDQLFDSYNIDEEKIILKKDIDSMLIDVDTMIPLGLIINELISNALKHAFTEAKEGNVIFSLKDNNETIVIKIKDNGKGMNEDTFKSSKSFGNKMVYVFVQKLKGDLKIAGVNGTEFTLVITKNRANANRA